MDVQNRKKKAFISSLKGVALLPQTIILQIKSSQMLVFVERGKPEDP